MSYLVIARKWRPKLFSEVVGQGHVTRTLENAIESDRIASAYIFSGPRGVGKTTTARILAKALNCENGPTTTPCNECSTCKEITGGNSIDVLEIDGASNRGIDEIRNLRESARYTPAKQKHKIYIIDEVHMLTTEAFNALLKTLEEPPPHVIFIFATTENSKVPATILSRCQRFDFKRIAITEIVAHLKTICEADSISYEDGALYLIAKKGDGSMRDSQSLLDQVVSFCGNEIKEDQVGQLLGVVKQDLFIAIGNAVAEKNIAQALSIAQQIYNDGLDAQNLMASFAEFLNNILILKATQSTNHLLGMENYVDAFKDLAAKFPEIDLTRMIQVSAEAAADMKRSANPHLHLEMTFVRLAQMSQSVQLNELLSEIGALKKKANQPATASLAPATARPNLSLIPEIDPRRVSGSLFKRLHNEPVNAPAAPTETTNGNGQPAEATVDANIVISIDEVAKKWGQILTEVRKKKISLGSCLSEASPSHLKSNVLYIQFDGAKRFQFDTVSENKNLIQQTISEILETRVRIECFTSGEPAASKLDLTQEKEQSEPAIVSDKKTHTDYAQNAPESGVKITDKLIDTLGGELLSSH